MSVEELNKKIQELEESLNNTSKEKEVLTKKVTLLEEELDKAIYEAEDVVGDNSKEENEESDKSEDKGASDSKDEMKQLGEKLVNAEKIIGESKETIKTLEEHVKKLVDDNKSGKETILSEKKKALIKKLQDNGHYPAFIKQCEKLVNADNGNVIMTLSEKTNDGEVKQELSISEIVNALADSLPEEARFNSTEKSKGEHGKIRKNSNMELMEPEEVEKYASENKISYTQALVELSKNGKI